MSFFQFALVAPKTIEWILILGLGTRTETVISLMFTSNNVHVPQCHPDPFNLKALVSTTVILLDCAIPSDHAATLRLMNLGMPVFSLNMRREVGLKPSSVNFNCSCFNSLTILLAGITSNPEIPMRNARQLSSIDLF